jgi:hypothetical protein
MRLDDFSFPGGTLPAIRSRSAEFNSWIERVKARSVEAIRRVLAACQDIQQRSGV